MPAGQLAAEMTTLPHSAAPRLLLCFSCFGSMRQTIRPASPDVASIFEHPPRVGDVDEPVFNQRRCFHPFVAGRPAEWDRIGELEVLDAVPVDARERREALAVVGAVVH